MARISKSTLSLLGVVLCIICVVGVTLAAQRYYTFQAMLDSLRTMRALDESFIIAVQSGSIDSTGASGSLAKSVRDHLDQMTDISLTVSKLTSSLESMQFLEGVLWIAALVLVFVMMRIMRAGWKDAEV